MINILLGDSHVRSYVAYGFDLCIFLGPGKSINFRSRVSTYVYILKLCFVAIILASLRYQWKLWLVLGEPDLRYACYGTWRVDQRKISWSNATIGNYSSRSLQNIKYFMIILRAIFPKLFDGVIGVGTPNRDMSDYALHFNDMLSNICEESNVKFFDPMLAYKKSKYPASYLSSSYLDSSKPDNTHFSSTIGKDFVELFPCLKKGISNYKSINELKFFCFSLNYTSLFSCHKLQMPKLLSKLLST